MLITFLPGRYTPAAITTIITNLVKAFSSTFPSSCMKDDRDLPSLLAFHPIPLSIIPTLQALPVELHLEQDVIAYLQDVAFIGIPSPFSNEAGPSAVIQYARLFDAAFDEEQQDRERLGRRMKAEMHLAGTNGAEVEIVPLHTLTGISAPAATNDNVKMLGVNAQGQGHAAQTQTQSIEMTSPAYSCASLTTTETDQDTTASDDEALTPDLLGSLVLEPGIQVGNGNKSRSASLEAEPAAEHKSNMLGMRVDHTATPTGHH